eukprot:CAMPEP_0118934842 /NCGR_PEP_ID=MMETSP1169-20130426/14270_1 /TAXON_ID=36882 /ORGANISM="Pyramimonas obovata, Strain CCMP722" /LENGTH=234 /DNA_ID=CAMNT_0006877785 /DNA_START=83 /DNA_END=787 /DNA_ORIENTATION=-
MNTCAIAQPTRAVAPQASCTTRKQDRCVAAAPSARVSHVASARLSARRSTGSTAFAATRTSARQNMRRTATVVAEDAAETTEEARTMDINEIMAVLPHRYPFLLVDRVTELYSGKSAKGYKCVTVNDNFFPGHFPGRPLMPGVLQVEAMAQLGGLVLLPPGDSEAGTDQIFFFGGIDSCRFKKTVIPGDKLEMEVELIKMNPRFGIAKMKGKAYVDGTLACEAELMLVLAKDKK